MLQVFFSIKRDVRQGCPLSGLLFVIGLELLARAIKRDALIKGIVIGKEEIKTTIFVQDTESILQLLTMLEKFRSISGLKGQYFKNRGYVAGLLERQARYPFQLQMARRAYLRVRCLFSYDKVNPIQTGLFFASQDRGGASEALPM